MKKLIVDKFYLCKLFLGAILLTLMIGVAGTPSQGNFMICF